MEDTVEEIYHSLKIIGKLKKNPWMEHIIDLGYLNKIFITSTRYIHHGSGNILEEETKRIHEL